MCGGVWSPAQDLWFYSSHSFFLEAGGYSAIACATEANQRAHWVPLSTPKCCHSNSSDLNLFFFFCRCGPQGIRCWLFTEQNTAGPSLFYLFYCYSKDTQKDWTLYIWAPVLCHLRGQPWKASHRKLVTCRTGVWPWVCLTFYFSAPLSAKKSAL